MKKVEHSSCAFVLSCKEMTFMQLALVRLASRNSESLRLAALTLFAASFVYGQSTNPLELLKQPTPPANERIVYDKDPLQFAEMRIPGGTGPFPVAILVHGGCWSAKLKSLPEAVTSFERLRPMASPAGARELMLAKRAHEG
jgi:hypothetical protein